MLLVLDAEAVLRWCTAGRQALAVARHEIDELNVFPVPDADTGTNLLLTMEAAEQAAQGGGPELDATLAAMAQGALTGARGNSGVLLSQLLRGLADGLGAAAEPGPGELADGLRRAADLAYAAVASPVEGTMLTVARAAADAASTAAAAGDLHAVAQAALAAATTSLTRTPDLLPALHRAGVVDAGGRGVCVLLGALADTVTGQAPPGPALPARQVPARQSDPYEPAGRSRPGAGREAVSEKRAYEVQYLLRGGSPAALSRLRSALSAFGDSVAVVGGPELANVHVHVDDVGAAIEAGLAAGTPSRITVERFEVAARHLRERRTDRAVVALAAGSGIAALLRAGGAVVVTGPARPASAEVLRAVLAAGRPEVAVLPNDAAAQQAAVAAGEEAQRHGVRVAVVATRSAVQGLAALAVTDPQRAFDDDVAAMSAAAAATRWGSVAVARSAAATPAGPCLPGQALGLLADRTVLVGTLEQVATGLVDRLLPAAEMLTVLLGRDAPAGLGELLRGHVAARHPHVTATVVDGGQPGVLLLGAE